MIAMLLAAGRGERMGALTAELPKPLLSLGQETLIERQVRALQRAGARRIVINLSYRGARIREFLGDGARYGVALTYSNEGEPPLETGGGIIAALPWLGSAPFLLANADVVSDFDFRSLLRAPAPSCLVLVPNPAHHQQGDFGYAGEGLIDPLAPRLTYAGMALLDPELFRGLPPGRRPLRGILDAGIARGVIAATCHRGLWIDAGTPERLADARAAVAGDAGG